MEFLRQGEDLCRAEGRLNKKLRGLRRQGLTVLEVGGAETAKENERKARFRVRYFGTQLMRTFFLIERGNQECSSLLRE